jgi:hypothetical protein
VALGAGELGVRLLYRDLTTTSPIESWFGLRWKEEHLRCNRFGFRDGEFSPRKPPGVYRIVVVGDSFTARWGSPRRSATRSASRRRSGPRAARSRCCSSRTRERSSTTASRRCARPSWIQVRLGLTLSYEAYLRARFGDPRGEGSRRAAAELRAFFDLARGAGVPVAAVLFPHLDDRLGGDDPFAFLHEQVLGVCAEASVACVDLRDAFAGYAGRMELLRVNRFDHHAGALAHRLAAERLLEALGPLWSARASRPPPP